MYIGFDLIKTLAVHWNACPRSKYAPPLLLLGRRQLAAGSPGHGAYHLSNWRLVQYEGITNICRAMHSSVVVRYLPRWSQANSLGHSLFAERPPRHHAVHHHFNLLLTGALCVGDKSLRVPQRRNIKLRNEENNIGH